MITSIKYSCSKRRPEPKVGDRKLVKGVWHTRQILRDDWGRLVVNSRGGYRWEWVREEQP